MKEEKRKKKNPEQPTQEKKGKRKSQKGQKVRMVLFVGPLYVFNYNIVIELWVMETENWVIKFGWPNNL